MSLSAKSIVITLCILAGIGLSAYLFSDIVKVLRPESGQWTHYGYDASNSKFSPLDKINAGNVNQLKQVWHLEDSTAGGSGIFFNPLIVGGKMIVFMPSKVLKALDAATGRVIWSFKPDSTEINNWTKGATYVPGTNGRQDAILFVFGSTLYSVNAENGTLMEAFGEGGKVDFYTGLSVDPAMRKRVHVTSNAPGVIYKDLFIVGCKVPDELPSTSGDIRAFNVHTGKLEWIFHTIPKEGEYGYDTWPATARKKNGGANCWGGMALDEDRGIVYVPTASPSFDFYGADREGQNLFANCLLALDAGTGKRLWHFQTTHHDLWDRDNGSPPNLVTIQHAGKMTDAVALVTKMGYVFVFDRQTGQPLFPIEEVPVPTASEMPGEKPWPTQPIPTKPAPFTRQSYKEEYYKGLSPESKQYIKQRLEAGKFTTGVYVPPSLNGSVVVPAAHGGANWGGASFNPNTGILFVNATELPWFLKLHKISELSANNALSGQHLFKINCSNCHGADKKGTSYGPDIAEKTKTYPAKQLESIIKKGAEPMPSFQHLPQLQIDAIIAYLKDGRSDVKVVSSGEDAISTSREPYGFSGYNFFVDDNKVPLIDPPFGTLTAIDLNKGEILWQVPLGEDEKLAAKGIKNSGMYNRGGGIATAGGLVFIAATGDKKFRAFEQATGKMVWEKELPGNAYSIPSSYLVNKAQCITIAVSPNPSTGYKGGYITFSLDK
ncbi:PQQ-binding-like beta-propeller repeat protein [Rhodocytophaga aerolata]|uniref:PQQ-binding-like beta-propeller repeat protein n=1 Tax=Rhodocytophaga aerolata TaxID=455078 RepID=A0ABT8RBD4_9BACT|nr:PQQ-binding-like beta-propeller repeat protein [Rhodocytophaga aerolata]MDO1449385.1 PQQ-binding-like beta-propeller repeat protein [Rhodocytophaga aerolata]